MNTSLMYCRSGFKSKVCAEIAEHAATPEIPGYAKNKPTSTHVELVCQNVDGVERLMHRPRFADLIFPCQQACGSGFTELPESQRIEMLLAELVSYLIYGSLRLEALDASAGREVSILCRKFEKPPRITLVKAGRLQKDPALPRLLLTFHSGREAFAGLARPCNSALWPMGIPRLKFSREAPSRSTLKPEEAWHQFIPRNEWDRCLAPDMLVMDLGVALSGWTW